MFEGVNFLAVAVITAVIFIFAFIYYGPILGKQWMKYAEFSKEKQQKNQKRSMLPAIILGVAANFVMVTVISLLQQKTGVSSVNEALMLSCMIWVGFFVTTSLGAVLWEMKSVKLWLINNGYTLVAIFGAGLGLFYWN